MKKRNMGLAYGIIAAISYRTNPLFALPLYAGGIGVNSVLFYRYLFRSINLWFVVKICKENFF